MNNFINWFEFKVTAILGGLIYLNTSQKDSNGNCTFDQRSSQNITLALFYTITVSFVVGILAAVLVIISVKMEISKLIKFLIKKGFSIRNSNLFSRTLSCCLPFGYLLSLQTNHGSKFINLFNLP